MTFLNKLITALFLLSIGSASVYTVPQTKTALVIQLGKIKRSVTSPGLHFKLPIIQLVKYLDNRIFYIDELDSERFITSEKKNINIVPYIAWSINDPILFYKSIDSSYILGKNRITQTTNSILREELGKQSLSEIISSSRSDVLNNVIKMVNIDLNNMGIIVKDIRFRSVDLTEEISESVYKRMEAERYRVANKIRSEGDAEAEKLKASADSRASILLSDARKKAALIKAKADSDSMYIYAKAYSANTSFSDFYQSIEVMKNGIKPEDRLFIYTNDHEIFKNFNYSTH